MAKLALKCIQCFAGGKRKTASSAVGIGHSPCVRDTWQIWEHKNHLAQAASRKRHTLSSDWEPCIDLCETRTESSHPSLDQKAEHCPNRSSQQVRPIHLMWFQGSWAKTLRTLRPVGTFLSSCCPGVIPNTRESAAKSPNTDKQRGGADESSRINSAVHQIFPDHQLRC